MSDVSRTKARPLARLGTGVTRLDDAMQGGFPVQSVTVLSGEPGTGKTVLALQTMFAAARQGRKCLYFTTLSEPSLKLIRYMQLFEFFDQQLLDTHIKVLDLGTVLRGQKPESALTYLAELVEGDEPELVVIDSYKAIHDLLDSRPARTFTYDLAVQLTGWGVTTLLVGEYVQDDFARLPEFAIADGIVRLGMAHQELAAVRELEIRKLRGSGFASGVHFFDIQPDGIHFYPRVRAPEMTGLPMMDMSLRVSTGVAGLDELLQGGVPASSTTVVMGGTGTGKTLLGLHFVVDGARRGERCAYFTLEESLDQLIGVAHNFGFDLPGLKEAGTLQLHYEPPVELSTDRLLDRVRRAVESTGVRRLVLDSLSSLALGAVSERRYKELVYALAKYTHANGITLLTTMETAELLGSAQLSGHGVSFAADNVVQLRYIELGGRLERAISVVKARGVNVNTELRPVQIGERGLTVGSAREFKHLRGVLTGMPLDAGGR